MLSSQLGQMFTLWWLLLRGGGDGSLALALALRLLSVNPVFLIKFMWHTSSEFSRGGWKLFPRHPEQPGTANPTQEVAMRIFASTRSSLPSELYKAC